MEEYPKRSELAVGDFVEIAMYHQGNRKDKGEIESILTHAETHPHGIMVALTNKKIGRVQRKLPPPAKIPIDLDIAKKLHDKIEQLLDDQEGAEIGKGIAEEQLEEAKKKLEEAEDDLGMAQEAHDVEEEQLGEAKKKLEDIKRKEELVNLSRNQQPIPNAIDLEDDDSLNKRAKKAAKEWVHLPEERHGKTAEEATKNKELFNKVKKILEKPSQDKQREVFLTKDIPEEEDDRNEFKESFKADTIYHKLLESGDKKAAEARKHDCESKEHVVKKEVSIAAAAFANSGSGRLFIGISDDPVEVVGLESDLSAFKNFDEYIRGISDSIKSFTKNQYFTQNIKFQHGEDRKFLVLHVPTGGVPIFIHDKDKEEFYTRGHGESCLCQHTDAHRWITERFPDWKP